MDGCTKHKQSQPNKSQSLSGQNDVGAAVSSFERFTALQLTIRRQKCRETDLVMAAGAHVRAAHPAVAGEEGAAAAQREAVGGVVAEKGRPARHRRHAPLLPGAAAGQLAQVRQPRPRRAPRPLQRAVAQQRVTGHQVHRPQAWHMTQFI